MESDLLHSSSFPRPYALYSAYKVFWWTWTSLGWIELSLDLHLAWISPNLVDQVLILFLALVFMRGSNDIHQLHFFIWWQLLLEYFDDEKIEFFLEFLGSCPCNWSLHFQHFCLVKRRLVLITKCRFFFL